jgi:hypothetical protein
VDRFIYTTCKTYNHIYLYLEYGRFYSAYRMVFIGS